MTFVCFLRQSGFLFVKAGTLVEVEQPLRNDFVFLRSPKPLEMLIKDAKDAKALRQTIRLFG